MMMILSFLTGLAILIAVAFILGKALTLIFRIFTKNEKRLRLIQRIIFYVILLLELGFVITTYMKRGMRARIKSVTKQLDVDDKAKRIGELNKLKGEGKITQEIYDNALNSMEVSQ